QTTFYYASLSLPSFEVCWSPKTNYFVTSSDLSFQLIKPDDAPPLDTQFVDQTVWKLKPGASTPCAWSPDGEKLALMYQSDNGIPSGVKIIDFAARQVRDLPMDDSFVHPFWSPDSRMLALVTYNFNAPGNLYIYDATTAQQVFYHPHLNFVTWLPVPS